MLQNFPALVLNADFRPLSLFPLELKDAKEAIKNVWEDTVNVVAESDRVIRSPSISMRVPSVVALRTYIEPATRVVFKDANVFLRDRHRCQYCGASKSLTIDHVYPTSKGGETTWQNVVAACDDCNSRKGDSVGVMHPMKVPREPTPAELHALERMFSRQRVHSTWVDFLPTEAA